MERYKIAIAGTGYVGLSVATLLAQHNRVTAVDVLPEKVHMINSRKSPIQDDYIERYLSDMELDLTATLDGASAYSDADFVVIAAPTNYDPEKNYFDTHCIEDVIDLVLEVNPRAVMVIKSTIPVGYCRTLYARYAAKGVSRFNLLFFPEFLRESKALYDNLYPSRIIAGVPKLIDGDMFAGENAAILSVTDLDALDKAAGSPERQSSWREAAWCPWGDSSRRSRTMGCCSGRRCGGQDLCPLLWHVSQGP